MLSVVFRATENLSETRGGTFDSNGAYHGVYSDDENDNPRKSKDPGMNENRYYASQSGGRPSFFLVSNNF
jgi:hypothetical protein